MQEADHIWVAKQRAGDVAFDDLPAWKQQILRNRLKAAASKTKTTDTVKRSSLAQEATAADGGTEVRRRAKAAEDERRLVTVAPMGRRPRFERSNGSSPSCSPIMLSLITELLGMRAFGALSEVCTAWYDGVSDKEEEWAVLSVKMGGGLGLGTGPATGQLDLPTYADVVPGNSVCVCDSGNARLVAFSPKGRVKGELSLGRGTRAGSLSMPCSVICDSSSRSLFVLLSDGALLKFRVLHGPAGSSVKFERVDPHAAKAKSASSRGGAAAAAAGSRGSWECTNCTYLHTGSEASSRKCLRCEQPRPTTSALEALVEAPEGCAMLGKTLFVACARWHRVVAFDMDTLQPLRSFGTHGRGLGQLRCPQGMAALQGTPEQQELYVADMHNDRIAIFSPQGACLGEMGFRGHGPGQFIYPRGVAILRDELVVVAERQRVQVLTLLGQPRQVLRVPGAERLAGLCTATRQVTWTGVRPLASTFLYVCDMDEGRLHELEVAGRTPVAWEAPTHLHTTLGSISLDGAHRRARACGDDDDDDARTAAAAPDDSTAGSSDTAAGAAEDAADASGVTPQGVAARAAAAARAAIAAERAAQLHESRVGDAAGKAHKLRQRARLLGRVTRHPRGEVGAALLETLELPANAPAAAVDHALRLVLRVLHPDFSVNVEAKGTKLGKDLISAFQKLSDLRDRLQAEREQQRAEEEAAEQAEEEARGQGPTRPGAPPSSGPFAHASGRRKWEV